MFLRSLLRSLCKASPGCCSLVLGLPLDVTPCCSAARLLSFASSVRRFLARSEERLTRPERMAKMFPRILSGTIQPLPAHVRLAEP
jgi:hypothetical protein